MSPARLIGILGLVSALMTLLFAVTGLAIGIGSIIAAAVIAHFVGMATTGEWWPWSELFD